MEKYAQRICLTLDLKHQEDAIEAYKKYHEPGNVWTEIIQSLYDSGILDMEIYLWANRLFMILEVSEEFTLAKKAVMDEHNPKVQEWENLMQSNFQQALPGLEKVQWMPMECVFNLSTHRAALDDMN